VKPESQRLPGLVKQRAGCQRCLIQTTPAHQPSPGFSPHLRSTASGTGEAVRPTQGEDVRLACFLAREALAEFYEVSRVISPSHWGSLEIHPDIIPSRELSGYPLSVKPKKRADCPQSGDDADFPPAVPASRGRGEARTPTGPRPHRAGAATAALRCSRAYLRWRCSPCRCAASEFCSRCS
jgi:hypothetical protein